MVVCSIVVCWMDKSLALMLKYLWFITTITSWCASIQYMLLLAMSLNIRKRTLGHLRPAKIQINLRIRAVWSESSLVAFWIVKDAKFLHADNENSNHTARMRRLIWVIVGHTCQKIRFLPARLLCFFVFYKNDQLPSNKTMISFPSNYFRICFTIHFILYNILQTSRF